MFWLQKMPRNRFTDSKPVTSLIKERKLVRYKVMRSISERSDASEYFTKRSSTSGLYREFGSGKETCSTILDWKGASLCVGLNGSVVTVFIVVRSFVRPLIKKLKSNKSDLVKKGDEMLLQGKLE